MYAELFAFHLIVLVQCHDSLYLEPLVPSLRYCRNLDHTALSVV